MNDPNKNVLNLKSSNFGFVSDFDIRISNLDNQKAQTILEYTIVMGVIVVIMFAMGPMIKRGIQSLIKTVADQIGIQRNADQRFDESGYLVSSSISTNFTVDKVTSEGGTGATVYSYNDTTGTISSTIVDLGFTPGN